jgi:hypothetical protein
MFAFILYHMCSDMVDGAILVLSQVLLSYKFFYDGWQSSVHGSNFTFPILLLCVMLTVSILFCRLLGKANKT